MYAGLAAHQYRAQLYDSDGVTLLYESSNLNFHSSNGNSMGFRVITGDSSHGNIYLDALGYSWDPNYSVSDNLLPSVYEGPELAEISWMAYVLDNQPNLNMTGEITLPMPEDGIHSLQLYMNDSYDNIYHSAITNFTIDKIDPELIVNSPTSGENFYSYPPEYNISFIEQNPKLLWYSIDGGITNFTISELDGLIDEDAWNSAPFGPITIIFYIKDVVNHTHTEEVVIWKTRRFLNVILVNEIFSESVFTIELFLCNDSDDMIDFASIQMWWDGEDVSKDVQNLGGGYYFVSLDPITVSPSDDPILLNMTISAVEYENHYLEMYLAVDPETIDKDIPQEPEEPDNGGGGPPPLGIGGYHLFTVLSIVSLITMVIIKKKFR